MPGRGDSGQHKDADLRLLCRQRLRQQMDPRPGLAEHHPGLGVEPVPVRRRREHPLLTGEAEHMCKIRTLLITIGATCAILLGLASPASAVGYDSTFSGLSTPEF